MTVKNRRAFELRLGKVGLIVFIGGMSVLLFSLFLLGVIVGKAMEANPEQYASGITELIRDRFLAVAGKQERTAPPAADQEKYNAPAGGGTDFGLTFYDTLGGKKASPAGSAADTGSPVVTAGPTKGETDPPVSAGAGNGTKVSHSSGATPAGGDGLPKPPAGESGLPGKGRFEVQVAAYRERSQAEQLTNKIAAMGYAPRIVMKELPEKGRWFRVIVGGFASRETAKEAADQITGKIRGLKFVIRASD